MDEFLRKRARNDYTLMTLWELGVRKLRVPISDLLEADTRERMGALRTMGHEFTAFCFEAPDPATVAILAEHRDLVDVLEVVTPWQGAAATSAAIAALKESLPLPVMLAKMETSAEKKTEGSRFSHFVSYGFHASELDLIEKCADARGVADGFVFRLRFDESPWEVVPRIVEFTRGLDRRAVINVRLASENPAEYQKDDGAIANQVAEALLAAFACGGCELFIDTYVDVDRGYFPRHGLFDRRYNPRPASFVYRYLQGWLGALDGPPVLGDMVAMENGRVGIFSAAGSDACLLLPGSPDGVPMTLPAGAGFAPGVDVRLVDLSHGGIVDARVVAGGCRLVPPAPPNSPSLVIGPPGP